ncbi:transmembrane 7 superfamily member 3-like, partial [Asbolus verrucosus]
QAITFDLSDYDPTNATTATQKLLVNLTVGLTQIQVTNIPDDIGFFIVQVHSYPYNVTLSSSYKMKKQNTIKGTNIGLVSLNQKKTTFYVKSKNFSTALIVVVIYKTGDPIPGGCNLTFNTENAPYQLISFTDDLIIVQSQPPSAIGTTCEKNNVLVELYHLYLHEDDFKQSRYFNGLEKMLTVDAIKVNGYKVTTVDGYFKYRKLYSAYRGVGQVFGIIATYQNKSSAYIPAISYGKNNCFFTDRLNLWFSLASRLVEIWYSNLITDLVVFRNDVNFWLTFFSIIIAFCTMWTMFTLKGHIFSCSFLGAYACVAALNFYTGGNLQYIVINSFRRMTVKNFNMATIDPPFQIMDISQTVLLVVMTTFGFYYQMKEQRGKPPFPPHRYATVEEGWITNLLLHKMH